MSLNGVDALGLAIGKPVAAIVNGAVGDDALRGGRRGPADRLVRPQPACRRGRACGPRRSELQSRPDQPRCLLEAFKRDLTPKISIGTNDEEARTRLAETRELFRSGLAAAPLPCGPSSWSFQPGSSRADERSGIRRALPAEPTAGQRRCVTFRSRSRSANDCVARVWQQRRSSKPSLENPVT